MANNYLKYQIVKKATAIILLFLFAFSVTPIKVVHDLVAKHKDTQIVSSATGAYKHQLNKPGFNCLVDNHVVELPFISPYFPIQIIISAVFPLRQNTAVYSFVSSNHPVFGLRGPPVKIA